MKKFLVIISIIVVLVSILGVALTTYEKMEKDRKTEEAISKYKSKWNIGSIHTCKLDEIRKKGKESYFITDTNRGKYKDGTIQLNFKDKTLVISFTKNKSIVAKKLYDVYKKDIGTMVDGYDFYYYSPREYGYENLRFVPQVDNFFIFKNEGEEVRDYICEKKS